MQFTTVMAPQLRRQLEQLPKGRRGVVARRVQARGEELAALAGLRQWAAEEEASGSVLEAELPRERGVAVRYTLDYAARVLTLLELRGLPGPS